jgi:hypothetical protein
MLSWLKGEKVKGDRVDHPLADVREAQKVIDAFPVKDPLKTLEAASHWLASVNETEDFKLEQRFEVLDLLDVTTRKAQAQLIGAFLTILESDRVQEKRIWKIATDFWKLLGDGYLVCVKQAQDSKSVPLAFKPRLPVLAARATRALRHQMKWILMRYGAMPSGIWAELGQCMVLAEAAGVDDSRVELYTGVTESSSPRYEFLRAMMLWAGSPSGLSPIEQDIAERLVVRLTPNFRYSAKPWDSCDYFFDLDGTRAPLRLMPSAPLTGASRFFDVNDARPVVEAMALQTHSAGQLPKEVDWNPAVEAPAVVRVLKHLLFNWAKVMPPRAHQRRRTAMSLHVVQGYQNVLGVIQPGTGEGLDFSSTLSHESWIAEDVSAGGYGLIVPVGKGEWLRVGMLVALQSETDASWHIGIIRRVKSDEHRQHRIGVQLISKSAVAVHLRSLARMAPGSKRQSALLLSTRPSSNGSLHIVARRDLFGGRESLEALHGEPPTTVILETGGLVENGYDFDWLRYKVSEPIA